MSTAAVTESDWSRGYQSVIALAPTIRASMTADAWRAFVTAAILPIHKGKLANDYQLGQSSAWADEQARLSIAARRARWGR